MIELPEMKGRSTLYTPILRISPEFPNEAKSLHDRFIKECSGIHAESPS